MAQAPFAYALMPFVLIYLSPGPVLTAASRASVAYRRFSPLKRLSATRTQHVRYNFASH